jgi:hypothetical protein
MLSFLISACLANFSGESHPERVAKQGLYFAVDHQPKAELRSPNFPKIRTPALPLPNGAELDHILSSQPGLPTETPPVVWRGVKKTESQTPSREPDMHVAGLP